MVALEFDALRLEYLNKPEFQLSTLNLLRCLPTLRTLAPEGFILDMGGDTLFRPDTDNDARLANINGFKAACAAAVVLLAATKAVVLTRYVSVKGGIQSAFEADWTHWQRFGAPRWKECADIALDTSSLDPIQVAAEIELRLKAGSS